MTAQIVTKPKLNKTQSVTKLKLWEEEKNLNFHKTHVLPKLNFFLCVKTVATQKKWRKKPDF